MRERRGRKEFKNGKASVPYYERMLTASQLNWPTTETDSCCFCSVWAILENSINLQTEKSNQYGVWQYLRVYRQTYILANQYRKIIIKSVGGRRHNNKMASAVFGIAEIISSATYFSMLGLTHSLKWLTPPITIIYFK